MNAPIPTTACGSPYATKPRRTGAFVLARDEGGAEAWLYTARPELWRTTPADAANFPFWQTPAHMRDGGTDE
jgi:hypothetical protein